MRVFIVGAGAVASVLAKELAKEKNVNKIVCGSRNIENAKKYIKENKKVSLIQVDASNVSDISEKVEGFDLIINSSLPHFNKNVMAAALEVGANYLDLDSENADLKNPEQFEFDSEFKKRRAIGLMNAGISPGITNLFVRESAEQLDSIEEIKIRGLEDQKAKKFIFAWSPHVNIDELKARPLIVENGKFALTMPLEGEEEYTFPGKLGGKRKVYDIYGDEIATLAKYFKAKKISYKVGGADIEFARMHRDGNGAEENVPNPQKMIELMRSGVIEDGIFISSIECFGKRKGKKIMIRYDIIYPSAREVLKLSPGATYISYATGIAAAEFAKSIDLIKQKGVFPAETLDSEVRKKIISGLKKKGVKIKKKISYI